MKNTQIELVNEVLDLSIIVLREFFKKLKKTNPTYYETIKPLVYWDSRSMPSFLEKRKIRTKEKFNNKMFLEGIVAKTWLSVKEIKELNNKWIWMSYIIKEYSKNESTREDIL